MDILLMCQLVIVIRDQGALTTLGNLMVFLWFFLPRQIHGDLLHFSSAMPVAGPTDQPRQQASNCQPQGTFCYMNKI